MIMLGFIKNFFSGVGGSKDTGSLGEDESVKFLKKEGYKIVERNFSSKAGEIDVIATENNVLVFVEVKTRSSTSHGRGKSVV